MHRRLKALKRYMRKKKGVLVISALLFLVSIFVYTGYIENRRLTVNPVTYRPLLDLIAWAESSGNYNAYFGNAGNSSIVFTNMSIGEVMAWQSQYIEQGNPSSAVGRYQLISTTLAGLVRQLGIDPRQRFDQAMQDRLAIALLERRGSIAYVNNELSREQFAANLAQEWAGLPKVIGDQPAQSFYASDGLNAAHAGISEVLQAIEPIRSK